MTDEEVVSTYICSECKEQVTSEGTEAIDHMVSEHGVDPEAGPQDGNPYLIPLESNPEAHLEG